MPLTPVGDMGIALKADVDDFQKSMRTSKDSVALLTGSIRGLAAGMRNLGIVITGASALAGAAMFGLARKSERVSAAFREVDTISREVKDAQGEYNELVSDLNTNFGLQENRLQVIDGLYQSVSAGITEGADAQREFLETAAQLAVVGRVDLATSVDVLSTVINTYGMEVGDAQDVSESLFQTVQFGKIRMEELAPVIGRVAALGSEMNVQIDEIGTSMAVLTRTGFEARIAATGLRNIFRAMMRPSETMQSLLQGIALENEQIAEQWNEQSDLGNDLAQTYRDTANAINRMEEAQRNARKEVEENSLVIQEARLKIQAIEEGRIDQLGELTSKEVENADSVESLNKIIENHRFQVNKARLEEEQHRISLEEQQAVLEELRSDFKNNVDIQGDLEGSVGDLVLQEQGFIETLVELRQRADEQNIAFNELFPRTRALQGALALVGEDGQLLIDIFEDMEDEVFSAEETWNDHEESLSENFDSFEDFKESVGELNDADLDEFFDEATGPQQEMRNATSKLKEAIEDLGAIFTDEVTGALSDFADSVTRVVDGVKSLEERTKENIGRFSVLAVVIGLVLGPMLLFLGQLALISLAMGTMFIPFLAIAGTLIGGLASAFVSATDEGDSAETIFSEMSSTFSVLTDFISRVGEVFSEEVLPEMIFAGEAFLDLIRLVSDDMGEFMNEEDLSPMETFAQLIGGLFRVVGEFINENKELISSLIVFATDTLVNEVIPAVSDFGNWIKEEGLPVLKRLTETVRDDLLPVVRDQFLPTLDRLIGILKPVILLVFSIVDAIGSLVGALISSGEHLSEGFVGTLVEQVQPALTDFILGVRDIVDAFRAFLETDEAVVLLNSIGIFAGVLVVIFTDLVGIVGQLLQLLAPLLVPVLRVVATVLAGIIGFATVFLVVAAGVLKAIRLILDGFIWLKDRLVGNSVIPDMMDAIYDVTIGRLEDLVDGVFEKGKAIAESIAEGIKAGIESIKDAAGAAMDAVGKFMPESPADEGYFSDHPPQEIGEGITGSIGSGMENSDIEPAMGLDLSNSDVTGEGGAGSGAGTDGITIEEKAVFFESGAFQGVADEEIPEMVSDEVNMSLQDIITRLESKGRTLN